jgi:hypothetical protein
VTHLGVVGKSYGKRQFERSFVRCEDTISPSMPKDNYSGRTAPLTSKRCI